MGLVTQGARVRSVQLTGAVALVTGATGGIGRATAAALAEAGARLVLAGRDAEALRALADRHGGHAVPGDLTASGAVNALVAAAESEVGPVDLLVSNAGAGRAAALTDISAEEVEALLALNLLTPVQLTRLVLPGMVERRHGRVVLVGSIAGLVGVRNEAVYSAAKGGLTRLGESLSDELAGTGVGVTLVAPGAVATDFFARRGRAYDRRFPRPVRPERVAAAIRDAVLADRGRVVLPRWLEIAARLNGTAPGVYRALSSRFG